MKYNVFKFSDTCYRQKDDIAIGSVSASDSATIMFNFYVIAIIRPTFKENLRLDTRFIDDKIGVWHSLQSSDYNNYKTFINKMCKL